MAADEAKKDGSRPWIGAFGVRSGFVPGILAGSNRATWLCVGHLGDLGWLAYQFHREGLREGTFVAFRRHESPYPSARLRLRGLDAEASYELYFADAGRTETRTGASLAEGTELRIDERPGSLLVTYRQVSP